MRTRNALLAAAALLATGQALACFTVYDRNNRIVYNAQTPPVDMSQPRHETRRPVRGGLDRVIGTKDPLVVRITIDADAQSWLVAAHVQRSTASRRPALRQARAPRSPASSRGDGPVDAWTSRRAVVPQA